MLLFFSSGNPYPVDLAHRDSLQPYTNPSSNQLNYLVLLWRWTVDPGDQGEIWRYWCLRSFCWVVLKGEFENFPDSLQRDVECHRQQNDYMCIIWEWTLELKTETPMTDPDMTYYKERVLRRTIVFLEFQNFRSNVSMYIICSIETEKKLEDFRLFTVYSWCHDVVSGQRKICMERWRHSPALGEWSVLST